MKSVLFIVQSQDIYFFSIIAFPIVFIMIFLLFLKNQETYKDLAKANEQIREEEKKSLTNARLASLGVLAAGVGHEINNPLTIIRGNLEMMQLQLDKVEDLPDTISKYFEKAHTNITRIASIVNGLRVLSRVEDSKTEEIDLHASITQLNGMIKEIYHNERVKVELDLYSDSIFIQGNIGKLEQCLLNIVSNAKDAILENENIPGNHYLGVIKIKTELDSGHVKIKIHDNGGGISDDNLEKIFDTFFTTKEVGKGTGMGLSIVHSMVKEMQGKIDVESKVGEGTTFILSFKAKTQKEKLSMSSSINGEEIPENLKGRILIVEDEEELRKFLEVILSNIGLDTVSVSNGLEAITLLEKDSHFDSIITDLQMPLLSGEELITKINGHKDIKDIPVIVVTGGIQSEYNQEAFKKTEELSSSIIRKPFDKNEIYQALKKLL